MIAWTGKQQSNPVQSFLAVVISVTVTDVLVSLLSAVGIFKIFTDGENPINRKLRILTVTAFVPRVMQVFIHLS